MNTRKYEQKSEARHTAKHVTRHPEYQKTRERAVAAEAKIVEMKKVETKFRQELAKSLHNFLNFMPNEGVLVTQTMAASQRLALLAIIDAVEKV